MKKLLGILVSMVLMLLCTATAFGQAAQVAKPRMSSTQTTKTTTTKKTTKSSSSSKTSKKRTATTRSASSNSASGSTSTAANASNSSTEHEVVFTCNAPDGDLYIDNTFIGNANGTYTLHTGSHEVRIVAEGYDEYVGKVNVSASKKSFPFKLKKLESAAIQSLLEDMVFVTGGTFKMGSDESGEYDEQPAHDVTVTSFYICKYEVTQELWQEVMDDNPSENIGDYNPVESVSWQDCQTFISKLNTLTGIKFRLPTEAEWEYAARGGSSTHGYKYAGSDSLDLVAWYNNFDEASHLVGYKAPNELGLYDMSGNVSEWCSDWHGHYKNGAQKNPTGPKTGEYRVTRGGFWESAATHCTVTYRNPVSPDDISQSIGLRLAATSMQPKRTKK